MTYDSRIHHRHTIRLRGWDYSTDAAYFVTLCTDHRARLFGEVVDGHMRLNTVGTLAADSWRWLSSQYPYVVLDEWCVMPNHLHGILVLTGGRDSDRKGGSHTAPTGLNANASNVDETVAGTSHDHTTAPRRKSIGRLIGAFKTVSTKQINRLRETPGGVVWQRNFWERVVRDDAEMDRIRGYIRTNAANWATDVLNSSTQNE